MLDVLRYSDKNNLNILYNFIVNQFNNRYIIKMIKKFKNNNEVRTQIIEIIRDINLKNVKRKKKKFKFNKFYQKIIKTIKFKKKKTDL